MEAEMSERLKKERKEGRMNERMNNGKTNKNKK